MSGARGSRRAVAELTWDDASDPVERVGGRSLHQYWPVLSPYFRDVLLPPLRRTGANAVTWTWHEPGEMRAVTPAELRGLRHRLTSEQELLAENLARGEAAAGDAQAQRRGTRIHGLDVAMRGVIERLVAGSDAELSGYVCRTEGGLRLHSWGAPAPACVQYQDTRRNEGDADAGVVSRGGREHVTDDSNGRRRRRVLGVIALCAVFITGLGWTIWPDSAGLKREGGARVPGKMDSRNRRETAASGGGTAARRTSASTPVERAVNVGGARAMPAGITEARSESVSSGATDTPAPSEERVGVNQPRSTPPSLEEPEVRRLPSPAAGRPDGPNPPSGARRGGAIADGDSKKVAEDVSDVARSEQEPETKSAMTAEIRVTKIRIRADGEDAASLATATKTDLATENLREDESQEGRGPDDVFVGALAPGTEIGLTPDNGIARGTNWDRVTTVRLPRWQTRLLGDVILPTRPMQWSVAEDERALRARALEEVSGRMPATLRELQMRAGIGFEVGADRDGARLRWRGEDTNAVSARVGPWRVGCVELGWDEMQKPAGGRWVLEDESEGMLAEVRVAPDSGSAIIAAIDGVRAYQWFTAVIAETDHRNEASDTRRARFGWRRVTEIALPPGWRERRSGAGERELRVELPIAGAAMVQSVALFDRETGWAAVTEVAHRALEGAGSR